MNLIQIEDDGRVEEVDKVEEWRMTLRGGS